MKTAVITGASSGVGICFFNALCADLREIEEIWVIARRKDRLEQLEGRADVKVRVLALDLTDYDCIADFEKLLSDENPDIRMLINNAGFGKLGNVYELPYSSQRGMVELNCGALTAMCALCLGYMSEGSAIINVSSIAAFAPNPRMTVYSSTKAYVLSFTNGLRYELKKRRINALAVCPGPMATEFLDVAGIAGGKSKTFETLPYCNPSEVAKKSIKKARAGRAVYTPTPFYKLYRFLAKILPRSLVMKLAKT